MQFKPTNLVAFLRGHRQISLKWMLLIFTALTVLIIVLSQPYATRMMLESRGKNLADENWPTNAVVYYWPPPIIDFNGKQVSVHADPESGLMVVSPGMRKMYFRDGYNRRVTELLGKHGVPKYSLTRILPTYAEIDNVFLSKRLKRVKIFPHALTPAIRLDFDSALRIESVPTDHFEGMSLTMDLGELPVHTFRNGEIVYVRYGDQWMGVFHADGRLLFELR